MSGDEQQTVDENQETLSAEEQAAAEGGNTEPGNSTAPPQEGAADVSDVEQLKLTLQDAEARADEHWNQLLRVKAEMANMQRRNERDLENAHKFGIEKFVNELLPVRDSLELGLTAAQEADEDVAKVTEGIELTLKMFSTALEKMGVTEVAPQGEKFNPDLHQAMSMVDDPEVEPNTVLNVFQKGYLLNDRLVRPAMVVVASANSGGGEKVDEKA